MKNPSRVRLFGPLQEFGPGFVGELERLGYSPVGATLQVRLMARVSGWMQAEGLVPGGLSDDVVERFLEARRAVGHRDYVTTRAVAPLLAYLRECGVAPAASPFRPSTRAEVLAERFRVYLSVERGLAKGTVTGYVDAVKPFLVGLDYEGLDLRDLHASGVTAFVVARCPGQSRGAAKMTVCALRSLLGFMHVEGLIAESLTGAVPSAASWGLSGLPRFLEPGQAQALLDSCDQQTATGRRDLAILTLLLRLGLRAGEVAGLSLNDVDWRVGELVVLGKGRRSERLPLPVDVGEAISGYLRDGRPDGALGRAVFIRAKAPLRRLSTGGITQVVFAAGQRAGLGRIHAHRLRHTAATSMLRAGAPLAEIGQVLRHREALSTAIYAKVDRGALGSLARPWPGSGRVSSLEQHLTGYLAVRRAMGYKLARAGKLLPQFTTWMAERDQSLITTKLALQWATCPPATGSNWHHQRLSVVRGFAAYLHAIDPAHEVPAADLLPWRSRRAVPYLYTDTEILALMDSAKVIPTPYRAATMRTLIGLLAVTGMRIGEAIRLDRSDVDLANKLLVVRDTKFGKSREVALHPTTITALQSYLARRERPVPPVPTAAVFTSAAGTRLLYHNVHLAFKQIVAHAGLHPRTGNCRPRPHDLRHTFAVNTLLDAYRTSENPASTLPLLSTYMGHVHPGSTYWYLQAAPELLALAGDRLERHLQGASR